MEKFNIPIRIGQPSLMYMTTFARVEVGGEFRSDGTDYIKKSSRTAYVKDTPDRWFYFGRREVVKVRDAR